MTKVLLTITGVQNGSENIELITEGDLKENGKSLVLEYAETEISGMEGTKNIITVEDSMITLMREGDVSTSLYFEEGKRFVGNYTTQLGTLSMSVYPTVVRTIHDENSGKINLEYELDLEGACTINKLSLSYTKVDRSIS